jgi:hypothetical protein
MKTKDEMITVYKKWFADIAELRATYPLLVVMRDNSGENTAKELYGFFYRQQREESFQYTL